MKTRFLFFFILLVTLMAKAQTIEVTGLQSGVWDADTIKVTGDVMVLDSLYITPGTTVLFEGFYQIVAENGASLKAIGKKTDSILFTIADTTDFHVFNAERGGWNGIRLNHAKSSKFEYCRFQYGKAALDKDQDGGALRIFNSDAVEINHCTLFCNFSREHGGALNAEKTKVVMHNCDVSNNMTYSEIDTIYFMYGGGLCFLNCEVDITETDFRYNNGHGAIGGALSLDSCAVSIDRCRFEHNFGINGAGLYLMRSYDTPCSITNSLFANNTSGHFGGGLAISDASPEMCNLTVVGNLSEGVNCGGIFFYQHSSPVVRNCIVFGNLNEIPMGEPVQIWSWTYDDYAPKFYNCLVQFGWENISNNEVITIYESCLDEDPLFVGTENENYHLKAESPCIDAGSPDTPIEILKGLDLDGNPRLSDNNIDLGAYEYDLTDLHEVAQNKQDFNIVGNPITAGSYAEFELEKACDLKTSIYSVDGKLLGSNCFQRLQAGRNRIEIGEMFQSIPKGTYLFVVRYGQKTIVSKIVK